MASRLTFPRNNTWSNTESISYGVNKRPADDIGGQLSPRSMALTSICQFGSAQVFVSISCHCGTKLMQVSQPVTPRLFWLQDRHLVEQQPADHLNIGYVDNQQVGILPPKSCPFSPMPIPSSARPITGSLQLCSAITLTI